MSINIDKKQIQNQIAMGIKAVEEIKEEINKFNKNFKNPLFNSLKMEYTNQIKKWLNDKKIIDLKLAALYKKNEKISQFNKRVGSKTIDLQETQFLYQSLNDNQNQVTVMTIKEALKSLLKEGYRIIHSIRDIIMKEKIEYQVLYESRKNKQKVLHEQVVGMDRILENVYLKTESGKINIDIAQQEIENIDIEAKADIGKNISKFYKLSISSISATEEEKENSIIDDVFYRYLENQEKISQWLETKTNKGYIYEAYVYLTQVKFFNSNSAPKKEYSIIKAALQFAKRNSTPGWQGGDVGKLQVKNLLTGASLITMNSVDATMRELLEILSGNFQQAKERMRKLYIEDIDKAKNQIEKDIQTLGSEDISEELIQNIKVI